MTPGTRPQPLRQNLARGGWVLLGIVSFTLIATVIARAGRKVIYETRSRYNHIIVEEDDDGLRYLLFSPTGGYQSVRKPGDTDSLELPYSRTMMVGLACVEEPKNMLIIGLGGASIPTFLHKRYPRTRIDCVDIDPEVVHVAKKFFGLEEDDYLRTHVADGRKFIEEAKTRYDVVFLDAFGNDFIPPHLTTKEFLQAVRGILTPEGVVLGNVWGRSLNPLYDSMVRTYTIVFDEVVIVRVRARANVIVLAVPRSERLSLEVLEKRAEKLSTTRDFPFELGPLVRYGFEDTGDTAWRDPILEDAKEAVEAK